MDNVNQPAAGGSKTGMWVALIIAVIVLGVGAYFLFARENGTNTNNGNVVGSENSNAVTNQSGNANANSALNLNSPISDSDEYHFTDQTQNSFNGRQYMIRKNADEDFCGSNGSATCDLIEQRQGAKYVIADLFFPDASKAGARLQGAQLLTFLNEETIVIKYDFSDHGGGYQAIYSFNLETESLSRLVKFAFGETSACDGSLADSYSIEVASGVLTFTNCEESTGLANGVYLTTNGTQSALANTFTQPYDIQFDVTDNYESTSGVSLKVNGTVVQFSFTDQQFE